MLMLKSYGGWTSHLPRHCWPTAGGSCCL